MVKKLPSGVQWAPLLLMWRGMRTQVTSVLPILCVFTDNTSVTSSDTYGINPGDILTEREVSWRLAMRAFQFWVSGSNPDFNSTAFAGEYQSHMSAVPRLFAFVLSYQLAFTARICPYVLSAVISFSASSWRVDWLLLAQSRLKVLRLGPTRPSHKGIH